MTDRFKEQIERLNHLIDTLLTAVYAQGKEGRDYDDEDCTAQEADDALMAGIATALSEVHEAGRREEREECAKVAEKEMSVWEGDFSLIGFSARKAAEDIATNIRKRAWSE